MAVGVFKLPDYWGIVSEAIPLGAAAVALYVSLKLRPIERDIRRLETDALRVDAKLDHHLRSSTEAFTNFNRWRGGVSEGLSQNHADHTEIKTALRDLHNLILAHLSGDEVKK